MGASYNQKEKRKVLQMAKMAKSGKNFVLRSNLNHKKVNRIIRDQIAFLGDMEEFDKYKNIFTYHGQSIYMEDLKFRIKQLIHRCTHVPEESLIDQVRYELIVRENLKEIKEYYDEYENILSTLENRKFIPFIDALKSFKK
jgi:hypothetical protein